MHLAGFLVVTNRRQSLKGWHYGQLGTGHIRTVGYFCNSSVNVKLFQKKKFIHIFKTLTVFSEHRKRLGDAALRPGVCPKGQARRREVPVPGLPEASKPCAALAWPYRALFTAPILPSPLL